MKKIDPNTYDFIPEWKIYWLDRMTNYYLKQLDD
jgi:hypothetical protein